MVLPKHRIECECKCMSKKIMIINLCEPTKESLHRLRIQYGYAMQNEIDEVVLFVEKICKKVPKTAEGLKNLLEFIPYMNVQCKEKNLKTYLLLDSAISYYLSANDYKKILDGRKDIEIILNCTYEAIYNHTKVFLNHYTLNEVEDENVFLDCCLYVYITYGNTRLDKRAETLEKKILYIGPFSKERQYRFAIVEVKEEEPIFGVVFASECGYNDSCIFM